ncbi:MAG: hypothetical protein MK034_04500 [Dehalococcoidia bacterium]|nr:hypothetical protein [Dehalococcoidia bacterium]
MSAQPESTEQEVISTVNDYTIDGIDQPLSPLQYHYLTLLQRLISTKNSYQTDPQLESWMMDAIKKSVCSSLRDCIEGNVGDVAKDMLKEDVQVN